MPEIAAGLAGEQTLCAPVPPGTRSAAPARRDRRCSPRPRPAHPLALRGLAGTHPSWRSHREAVQARIPVRRPGSARAAQGQRSRSPAGSSRPSVSPRCWQCAVASMHGASDTDPPALPAACERVSAEAVCEILHKALPRKRRGHACQCHNDPGSTCPRQKRTFDPSAAMYKHTTRRGYSRAVTEAAVRPAARRSLDNRALTRRSVLEQSLRYGRLEARRMAFLSRWPQIPRCTDLAGKRGYRLARAGRRSLARSPDGA